MKKENASVRGVTKTKAKPKFEFVSFLDRFGCTGATFPLGSGDTFWLLLRFRFHQRDYIGRQIWIVVAHRFTDLCGSFCEQELGKVRRWHTAKILWRQTLLLLLDNWNVWLQIALIVRMMNDGIVIRIVVAVIVVVIVWRPAIVFRRRCFVVFLLLIHSIFVLCSRRSESTLDGSNFILHLTTFLCYGRWNRTKQKKNEKNDLTKRDCDSLPSKLDRQSASFFSDFLSNTFGR